MKIIKKNDPRLEYVDKLKEILSYYQGHFRLEHIPMENIISEALSVTERVLEARRVEYLETLIKTKPLYDALGTVEALKLLKEGFTLEDQENHGKEKENDGDTGLPGVDNKGTVRRGRKK